MPRKSRLQLFLILLLIIVFTVACNSSEEEVQLTQAEAETKEVEENETEEPNKKEENNDVEVEKEESENLTEIEPVTIEQEMWHVRQNKPYEIYGEVGPIVRDGDLAFLPVLLDTDDDVSITFDRLFRLGVMTGEGISSEQGYDIKLIDTKNMTVSQPAVLLLDDYSTTALHTFVGGGYNRNAQKTLGGNHSRVLYYGVFAAPETDSVEVMFRRLGVIENVPVIDREEIDTLTLGEIEELTDSELEEVERKVLPTVEEIIESELFPREFEEFDGNLERIQARVFPIESYRESLQTSVSRVDEMEHSTLIISSDVLFEFDSSDLLEEASEELEAVVTELTGVEDGELEIVGHTDDEGTDEYNQELSEDRAESVREELGELMDLKSFDVAVRGESFHEPIADNASEEGRAQNRRVEIHFTPPTEEVEVEVETEIPEVLGEEAVYPEAVHTEDGKIEIESIRQMDDILVGRIRVSYLEEVGADYPALTFGFGRKIGARGMHGDESVGYEQTTAYAPTLIHNNQRYYPLDYYLEPLEGSYAEKWLEDAEDDAEYIIPLAERNMFTIRSLEEGGYYTATVIWPAVDDEKVTVDLHVPKNFYDEEIDDYDIERTQPWRITDVPVERGDQ